MAKSRYKAPSKKTWVFDPHELVVIGVDTDHGAGDHALWRQRSMDVAAGKKGLWDDEMARDISRGGVVTTIVVRREEVGGSLRPVVVAGVRRVLHARKAMAIRADAGDARPLRIEGREGTADDLGVRAIAFRENRHRVDDDPIHLARAIQESLDAGEDLANVAMTFGISPASARRFLALLELGAKVQKMVGDGVGKMSVAAAREVAKVKARSRQADVARRVLARGGTKSVALAEVAAETGGPAPAPQRRPAKALTELRYRDTAVARAFQDGILYALGHEVGTSTFLAAEDD